MAFLTRAALLALLAAPAVAVLEGFDVLSDCTVGGTTMAVTEECCTHLTDTGVGGGLDMTLAGYLSDPVNAVVCTRNVYTSCLALAVAAVPSDGLTVEDAAASCAITEDSCCSLGERHVDGSVCCPAECTLCGGLGCALLGGDSPCCKTELLESAPTCESAGTVGCQCPGVETRSTPSPTMTPEVARMRKAVETVDVTKRDALDASMPREAMCAMGLVHDVVPDCDGCAKTPEATIQVCCDPACGTCGGDMCSVLSGPDLKCCVEDILESSVFCQGERELGCIIEAKAPWM